MKGRSNSVLTPSAQTSGLRSLRSRPVPDLVNETVTASLDRAEPEVHRAVIAFLEATGCRISEVLQLRPTDVSNNGTIRLPALKGSKTRIITPGSWSAFFLEHRLSLPLVEMGFDRHYFYRLFKRLGIYSRVGHRGKNSVTHYFRHKLAAELRDDGFEVQDIATALGHKSTKSTVSYGR
jgi:integrase